MNETELMEVIAKIQHYQMILDDAQAEIDNLKDELKTEMNQRNVEHLEVGENTIHYTTVQTTRFDTTKFKKEHSDIYSLYTKTTTSKRFQIA